MVVPARVVWSATLSCTVDRGPDRVHIGTTVQLKYNPEQMPPVTRSDIAANVAGAEDPEVRPDTGEIIVGMEVPSYDPPVVRKFVEELLEYLRTKLHNPGYEVADADKNAQRYHQYDWVEPAPEEPSQGNEAADPYGT